MTGILFDGTNDGEFTLHKAHGGLDIASMDFLDGAPDADDSFFGEIGDAAEDRHDSDELGGEFKSVVKY